MKQTKEMEFFVDPELTQTMVYDFVDFTIKNCNEAQKRLGDALELIDCSVRSSCSIFKGCNVRRKNNESLQCAMQLLFKARHAIWYIHNNADFTNFHGAFHFFQAEKKEDRV